MENDEKKSELLNSSQRQLIFYKYIYITTVQYMYIAFSNFWLPHTQVGELGQRIIPSFRDFLWASFIELRAWCNYHQKKSFTVYAHI